MNVSGLTEREMKYTILHLSHKVPIQTGIADYRIDIEFIFTACGLKSETAIIRIGPEGMNYSTVTAIGNPSPVGIRANWRAGTRYSRRLTQRFSRLLRV
jgi:hypothetical protein